MGLFGLHLPKKIDNVFTAVGHGLNPFDSTGWTSAPTQRQQAQAAQQAAIDRLRGMNPANIHGALANPQARQDFINQGHINFNPITALPSSFYNDIIKPAPNFIENSLVKPVTDTIAGTVVEPARQLTAQATHNPEAARAANMRGAQDIQNSLPVQAAQGIGNLAKAASYLPEVINAELHNKPIPNQANIKGLEALNKSYLGGLLNAPEKIIANNIPGARETAQAAGFNPNEGIASTIAKTAVGTGQALAPAYGLEYGNPLGVFDALNTGAKTVRVVKANNTPLVPNEIGSVGKNIGGQPSKFYRGGPDSEMPKGLTAQDIINYEQKDLGNVDVKPVKGIDPTQIKSDHLMWVTGDMKSARQYGKAYETGISKPQIIATDGQGGYLINTKPEITDNFSSGQKAVRVNKNYFTKTELAAGRALGLTKKQMDSARTSNDLAKAFSDAASKMTSEELANFKPSEQMAIARLSGMGPGGKAPAAVNLERNPFKSAVQTVQKGDYGRARIVPQTAAKPIKFVADRLETSMKSLQKSSPKEYANFWRYVESTPKNASPQLKEAIKWWREGANRSHAEAVNAGVNTNYIKDYALHPWDLKNLTEDQIASGGQGVLGKHAQKRTYRTIAEAEKANAKLVLGDNPTQEAMNYLTMASNAITRKAAAKALAEADAGELSKPHTLDLGYGTTVQLSDKGLKAAKAYKSYLPSSNKAVRVARTVNTGAKTTLLSGGQFHPINISVLRAGPSIALAGHPVRAAVGVARTFRPLLPGGKGAVNRVMTKAYEDKIVDPGSGRKTSYVEAAAQIGAPYMERGYNVSGTKFKKGVGHKMVFERQMPMMHDQVIRSVVDDLVKKKVPLNSEEARQAGIAANSTMGFINKEALNISPKMRQRMTDFMLAGQFTPSKIVTVSKVGKRGVAGKYARSDVVSNAIAATALVSGVGYLLGQKSDNIRDSLLRALINPSIPTPYKDAKGNQQELRIPLTYTGEFAKILGISLKRNPDGHLGVTWKPSEALSAHGGLTEWMRSRLSPVASTAVKLKTNTNFADKPLYEPGAQFGKQAIQAGTTIAQGLLPIGAQGAAYTKFVKEHLPGSAKEVLDANTPGGNPLIKSGASSFGFTPRTDVTVGDSAHAKTYFEARDWALSQAKNDYEKSALLGWLGGKKNPVTGKYDVMPSAQDSSTKAKLLLRTPRAFDVIYEMNQKLKADGEKIDPLWEQPKDKIQTYLQYQQMAPGSSDRSVWFDQNKKWYQPLIDKRNAFFNSLPKGDPNKPEFDLKYPEADANVTNLQKQYNNLATDKKGDFLDAHPELIKQWDAQSKYTNEYRKRLGYIPFKNYPEATDSLQKFISQYSAADKGSRKGIRSSNPEQYKNMIAYFDSVDLYGIGKQAGKSQLQGQPDYTSEELKKIKSLGRDIYKNPDGTYSIVPAGWMSGLSGGGSGGYGRGGGGGSSQGINAASYLKKYSTGGSPRVSTRRVSVKKVAVKPRSSRGGKVTVSRKKIRLA